MSVFLKAIDVLNERGWGQGEYIDETTGNVCLIGACTIAEYGPQSSDSDKFREWEITDKYTTLQKALDGNTPADWNDYIAKDKDTVIAALRKAHEYECELAKQIEHSSVQPA